MCETRQVIIPPEGPSVGKEAKECVLNDNDCPLAILLQHPPSKGKNLRHFGVHDAKMFSGFTVTNVL